MSARSLSCVLPLLGLALLAGCSSDGYLGLSGKVTCEGQPVETASISFEPVEKSASRGSGAIVSDGRFTVPRRAGVKPGQYRVTILASRPTGRKIVIDPMRGEVDEYEPLALKPGTPSEVIVSPDGPNRFDFELVPPPPTAR